MKKKFFILFWTLLSKGIYSQDAFPLYIKNFASFAVKEMHRTGIPASIKLAQGILESSFGESYLAKNANNHFGIKCGIDWKGDFSFHDDDKSKECFRKYNSILESFLDHSNFLKKPRYAALFLLPKQDYKAWARGLKKAGYATVSDYADRLIKRIEKYKLWVFDRENIEDFKGLESRIDQYLLDLSLTSLADFKKENFNIPLVFNSKNLASKDRIQSHENGKKKYIVIGKDESIEEISKKFGISITKLMFYNDLSIDKKLEPGQNLFLERKRNSGSKKFYKVGQKEDMHFISQKLGIRLKNIYLRNLMKLGEQPLEGEILYLRGKKKNKIKILYEKDFFDIN